jgi:hypothetical protein
MRLLQVSKLLHSTGINHQKQEMTYRMGERISIWIYKTPKERTIQSISGEIDWPFSKEEVQIANVKKWLSVLPHKENANWDDIYNPPILSSQNGNHQENNKCWWGNALKVNLIHEWRGCSSDLPLWRSVWRVLKNCKAELLFDPALPFLDTYLKECRSACYRDMAHPCLQQHHSPEPNYRHSLGIYPTNA